VLHLREHHAETAGLLRRVQSDLFALGSRLADPTGAVAARMEKTALGTADVERLEHAIDENEATLPALRTFILPGGTAAGATLHLARTVCRRAERHVVALGRIAAVDALHVTYLNRLSDLLFVLARAENHRAGVAEDPW
jgi:cob(I)alamin adenosyltransferase